MRRDLLALRSAPPVFGVAEAERIARDVYGVAVSVRPLSGERDCNFHLRTAEAREYVLKIVDGAADPQTTDCQVSVLRHLAEQDPSLPVPRIFATQTGADLGRVEQDSCSYATCLMGYLPGQLLADVTLEPSLLVNAGETLARVDRGLQGFFHPALAQRIAWDVRRLPELIEFASYIEAADVRRNVESVFGVLKERLSALRALRSQAIHGDCHAGNLLVDAAADAVCGVLDFGDMIHAPLILEPAVAMSELLTHALTPPDELSPLLEGYARVRPLEAADIAVLFDLITARQAVTILLHAWRGRHDGNGARVLDKGAANAASSLDELLTLGRAALTGEWHHAARISTPHTFLGSADTLPGSRETPSSAAVNLSRRHRLMGAGAELFYEKPLHLVRGAGVWLYDPSGHAYLDVYNNVPHVGHSHPTVVRAIQRQAGILVTHTRYLHEKILQYAEELTARCPSHLNACIFVNSGSEANDVAWRMARFATGHQGGAVMAHAYHGITDAVAALTPGAGQPSDPRVVTFAPPPAALSAGDTLDATALAAVADDADVALRTLAARGFAPAAFFIDSALTSSGIYDPPQAWLATVAARVRAAGGLVVADEVQYGLGRSGSHFWGFERRGLAPDIVTLGKPVGNGYPMGVVIAERKLIEAFQAKFGFFSTFGGSPVAAAAGLAVLEVLDREQLVANARTTGEYLRQRLEALSARHQCLGRVRGTGLLLGLEVLGPDAHVVKKRTKEIVNALASRARVLIGTEGPMANILKLRPPMPFLPEHADLLVQAIGAAAAHIESREG
ncbi:MAG TPA: aminotransferase class III-fold pyridoxal phosphate-dependent enzyme [Steroidobacteraceae bacterium]|nr:aminotransferase class III-fold pyridoxal phosphate-dependent enzyme [Steroidobacteraceae bacterium]